jgi:hypothetical protein
MAKRKEEKSQGAAVAPFGEALARLIQAKPNEMAKALANDIIQQRERLRQRIQDAQREIEDGARPRKGRFRI